MQDANPPKADDLEVMEPQKGRGPSRRSSVSSVASTGSHLSRGRRGSTAERKVKPKKRKKIVSLMMCCTIHVMW